MTSYQYEGASVLVKPPLITESALVKTGVTVLAGDILMDAGGADKGKFDQAAASSLQVKGVALEGRVGAAAETRPLTVVRRGMCRCTASGAIPQGAFVQAAGVGGGISKVKVAVAADVTAGKACGKYEAKSDGTTADAADGDIVIIDVDVTMNGVTS